MTYKVAKTNSQALQSPTDRTFFQIFLPGWCQKGALDSSQNVGRLLQHPSQLAAVRGVQARGESLCSFPSSSSPIPFFPSYICSFHEPIAEELLAFQEPGAKHPQCGCQHKPLGAGTADNHHPPWRPSAASEDLPGPSRAGLSVPSLKASVFCGRTLVSFTPIISFSLVAACSTYKVQLVSDRLPGFEDCITEHRSCLNGVQGKKEKWKYCAFFH